MKVVFLEKFIKDLDKITDRKARQSIKKLFLMLRMHHP